MTQHLSRLKKLTAFKLRNTIQMWSVAPNPMLISSET